MRRALVVTAVAIGCGRFGFDARIDGSGGAADASLDGAPPNVQLVQALAPGYGSAAMVSYGIDLTAGDLIVIATYWHQSADVVTVTDASSLPWQQTPLFEVPTGCATADGSGTEVRFSYAAVAQSGQDMITLRQPTGVHPIGAFLLEYSGATTTVDAQGGAVSPGPASGLAMTAGTLTTTHTDVVVALFNDTIGLLSMTGGSAYTVRGKDDGFFTLVEDRVVPPGTYSPDATLPTGATEACWAATSVAFRAQ